MTIDGFGHHWKPDTKNGENAMRGHFNASDAGPHDTPEDPTVGILDEIAEVVAKADRSLLAAGQGDFDKGNARNDWIGYTSTPTRDGRPRRSSGTIARSAISARTCSRRPA